MSFTGGSGRAFGLAGAMGMVTGFAIARFLSQVLERWGWEAWLVVAGCHSIINVLWISLARGPWLATRNTVEATT